MKRHNILTEGTNEKLAENKAGQYATPQITIGKFVQFCRSLSWHLSQISKLFEHGELKNSIQKHPHSQFI